MNDVVYYLLKTVGLSILEKKIKRKGLLFYLKAVEGVRRSLIGLLLLSVLIQMMVIGLIGSIIGGVMLLPTIDPMYRNWILLGVFGALFFVPFIIFLIAFSERLWFKVSGAEKLLNE